MPAAPAITTEVYGNAHVQHCLMCRRVRSLRREQDGSNEWEELTDFLTRYRLALSSLVVTDAYCETCETFYRQLLTYGQPGQHVMGLTSSGRITA